MAESSIFTTPVSSALLPVDIIKRGDITGIADNTETTIFTHTFLGDQTVGEIIVSGTDYARFNIYLNTVLAFVIRSGPSRQANLTLNRPWQLEAGDVVDLKVIHYDTTVTGDFNATMLGI